MFRDTCRGPGAVCAVFAWGAPPLKVHFLQAPSRPAPTCSPSDAGSVAPPPFQRSFCLACWASSFCAVWLQKLRGKRRAAWLPCGAASDVPG